MCEIEKGVLNNLFESRESNLYVLTEMDKKQIENLTKVMILMKNYLI